MNKPNHEKIYLVPEDGIYCWSITPAPGAQHESNDAVEYVRGDLFETMKAERDALVAQVEVLRSAIEPFATGGVCSAIDREDYSIMRERIKDWHGAIEFKKAQDAYNSTPQQCLREIEAKAGRAGFIAGIDALEVAQILGSDFDAEKSADEYATKVRQGGAE